MGGWAGGRVGGRASERASERVSGIIVTAAKCMVNSQCISFSDFAIRRS